MITQIELLSPVDLHDLVAFERAVSASGGWVLGRQLLASSGKEPDEDGLRLLRRLASKSENVISGDRGYCHVTHASVEEIRWCADRLLSQVRVMAMRVVRLRRAAHRRLHVCEGAHGPLAPGVLPGEIPGEAGGCLMNQSAPEGRTSPVTALGEDA